MHVSIYKALGLPENTDEKEVMAFIKSMSSFICKPCWELKYCPYGSFVEQSPLLPPTRDYSVEHNEYLKSCLKSGVLDDGAKLDDERRKMFEVWVNEFDETKYPKSIPKKLKEMECLDFGHLCPVYFYAEPFSETISGRNFSRNISRTAMMRVARRDNYKCQVCGESLLDSQIEFDHIIPYSKGGTSEESNIRVTCGPCNKKKSNKDIPGLRSKTN